MMIAIYTVFVGAGSLILLHQFHIDRAELSHNPHDEHDIIAQIRLDRKVLAVTLVALVVVSAVLYPL